MFCYIIIYIHFSIFKGLDSKKLKNMFIYLYKLYNIMDKKTINKKTTIQLYESTVLKLKKLQESLNETYDTMINKLINNYKKSRKK